LALLMHKLSPHLAGDSEKYHEKVTYYCLLSEIWSKNLRCGQ